MRVLLLLILIVVLLFAAGSSVFTVDRTQFVYLTQFGEHRHTYDGAKEAGLHFKLPWPIQSVQRLDRRLQVFDLPAAELLTHDREGQTIDRTLTVEAYVCWQIPGAEEVNRFIQTVGDPERAREILRQRISSRLGAEISNMPLDDLVSVAPADAVEQRMDRLRDRLLGTGDGPAAHDSLVQQARATYGIEIVDVRLRRFNYPPQVRGDIAQRIISERQKKAADYRSEGEKRAREILSTAEREASDILTDARSQEQRLKKEADIEADRIRNEAHSKDREFYTFLQKLEAYQRILGEAKDVLLLSTRHELFDLLLQPPRSEPVAPAKASMKIEPSGSATRPAGAAMPAPPAKVAGPPARARSASKGVKEN